MDEFKQQAKEYVKKIYIQHREDDIDAWNSLIDVLFLYIDHRVELEIRKCKDEQLQ